MQTRIEVVATFILILGAHMNIVLGIKVKIFYFIKLSYRSPIYVKY